MVEITGSEGSLAEQAEHSGCSGGVVAAWCGPWRSDARKGGLIMQWVRKGDAKVKRRHEELAGVEWGRSEAASSKRWYHID